jgi:hypothetical protein
MHLFGHQGRHLIDKYVQPSFDAIWYLNGGYRARITKSGAAQV